MILALAALVGVAAGLALGGSLERLARLELQWTWLVFAAVGLQVIAYPFPWLPWRTAAGVAIALWLVSFGLLAVAGWANRRVTGIWIVVAGMAANVLAVVANGGFMPAFGSALRDAGTTYEVSNNSIAADDPRLSWLVDRWAVPDWMPVGNVFSVGDVVIAVGVVVLVVAAMRPRLLVRLAAAR